MTDQQQPPNTARKRGRSPSYPGLGLEAAVGRAREFYQRERQHPTHVDAVTGHWGYSPKSGGASVAVAALKKFGLVVDEGAGGERRLRVTDLAVDILENPDPSVRDKALKTAALKPAIHAELWQEYGPDLPSDQNLRWNLVRQRGFTETGATEFLENYKTTIAFAGLDSSDKLSSRIADDEQTEDDDDADTVHQEQSRAPLRRQAGSGRPGVVAISVPVPGFGADQPAVIEFPGKLSESEWTYFMAVLGAMKAGVIKSDDEATD